MSSHHAVRGLAALFALAVAAAASAQQTPYPILFVTQFPISDDFATIGAVFANHRGSTNLVGRGGDLYIRYPDGSLRNLTQEAGYGNAGPQRATSIAVRDPAVSWDGSKAIFSMVIGAPPQQFQYIDSYWQLYEVTGLGQGQSAVITKVANQPAGRNNINPAYLSDNSIVDKGIALSSVVSATSGPWHAHEAKLGPPQRTTSLCPRAHLLTQPAQPITTTSMPP